MMKTQRYNHRAMCIWLPNWPLQRLYAARQDLKHTAWFEHTGRLKREVVLYEERRGQRVVACSGQYGIRPGMTRAEASALLGRNSSMVQFELHDPQADREALLKLAAWCEQFSPVVGIEGTDNLHLDITGLADLFGGEQQLLEQVQSSFERFRLQTRIAAADTVGAAWALAHFGRHTEPFPLGKKQSTNAETIAPLPLAALRVPETLVDILFELGIERIGQLLALPRDALAARFDPQLLLRLDQATGAVAEPILSHRPPPDIVAYKPLEYPVHNRPMIDLILAEVVSQVCQSLAERQQGAIQLECVLQCEAIQNCESTQSDESTASCNSCEPVKLLVGLFQASAQPKHLLELLEMQLGRLALPGPVAAVKMSVLIAAPLESRQQELFDGSNQEASRQVSLLVNRLSSRLGRSRVVRAVPQAEAQPELAFRYEPLTGVLPRKRKEHHPKRLPRPLRLEPEPISLEVMSVAPDGPPIQFDWQGSHRIAASWGPERIQTSWWRGRYIQRDYYRVETTTGKRFWLFRRLQDGKWFLHGVFD